MTAIRSDMGGAELPRSEPDPAEPPADVTFDPASEKPTNEPVDDFQAEFEKLTQMDQEWRAGEYTALGLLEGQIDAITFALYGTAHRWERANSIAYALAPTTNRCTVSLIFDVAGRRFSASSKSVLDTKMEVKRFVSRPIVSVTANPRTGPVPNW